MNVLSKRVQRIILPDGSDNQANDDPGIRNKEQDIIKKRIFQTGQTGLTGLNNKITVDRIGGI